MNKDKLLRMLAHPSNNPVRPPKGNAPQSKPVGMNAVGSDKQQSNDLIELENGFTKEESEFLHSAIHRAKLSWFDGKGLIMARNENAELLFRSGKSEHSRWVVMAFPIIDMNMDGALETALHFLSEAFSMAHRLDLQFHPAINMETENLEFLVQLPIHGLQVDQLAHMISQFVESLTEGIEAELSLILGEGRH